LIVWLVVWLIGCLVDWLVGLLVVWLIGLLLFKVPYFIRKDLTFTDIVLV
jgi:hypothetical protein